MKAKIVRGSGFRGVLAYASDAAKNAEFIGGTIVAMSAAELTREFALFRRKRPDVSKPVWHCSLALPKGDRLDSETWENIARDVLEKTGFDLSQTAWTAFRHQDTDHDHIHIVASRIYLDGKLMHGQFEALKAIEATQELEIKYGLTQTKGLEKKERSSAKDGELRKFERTGEVPDRVYIQSAVDEVLDSTKDFREFKDKLERLGVDVVLNGSNGISFSKNGLAFKGSKLGSGYSFGALKKRGLINVVREDREGEPQARPGREDEQRSQKLSDFGSEFLGLAEKFDSISSRFDGLSAPGDESIGSAFAASIEPAERVEPHKFDTIGDEFVTSFGVESDFGGESIGDGFRASLADRVREPDAIADGNEDREVDAAEHRGGLPELPSSRLDDASSPGVEVGRAAELLPGTQEKFLGKLESGRNPALRPQAPGHRHRKQVAPKATAFAPTAQKPQKLGFLALAWSKIVSVFASPPAPPAPPPPPPKPKPKAQAKAAPPRYEPPPKLTVRLISDKEHIESLRSIIDLKAERGALEAQLLKLNIVAIMAGMSPDKRKPDPNVAMDERNIRGRLAAVAVVEKERWRQSERERISRSVEADSLPHAHDHAHDRAWTDREIR